MKAAQGGQRGTAALLGLSLPCTRSEWWVWPQTSRPRSLGFLDVEQRDFHLEKQREYPMSSLVAWQKSGLL